MATNLLGNLPHKLIYRIDVSFNIVDKNVDAWIGRTAHIQFIENREWVRLLVNRYRDFFL